MGAASSFAACCGCVCKLRLRVGVDCVDHFMPLPGLLRQVWRGGGCWHVVGAVSSFEAPCGCVCSLRWFSIGVGWFLVWFGVFAELIEPFFI